MNFEQRRLYEWLSRMRRDFHMHPETAFNEVRTTTRIKEELTGLGVTLLETPDLETGAVGLIECGTGGKTLGLRADIDALTMTELNKTPYKSIFEGRMHACGHDAHTAILLGVAKTVVESGLDREINGKIKLIFQPAEETVSGAKEMIKSGVLEDPPLDRIVCLHVWPEMPVGRLGFYHGVSHAGADRLELEILGKGSHGAMPEQGADPIVAGAHFVTAVQSIISRSLGAVESGVVTVGVFESGTAENIIPEKAVLRGTIRSLTDRTRETIINRITDIATGLEKTFGVGVKCEIKRSTPPCVNDNDVTEALFRSASKIVGRENLEYLKPTMGAEDFGMFSQQVPGSVIKLGCSNTERGLTGTLHSPYFDMDEAALPIGVEVMIQAIKDYLS